MIIAIGILLVITIINFLLFKYSTTEEEDFR